MVLWDGVVLVVEPGQANSGRPTYKNMSYGMYREYVRRYSSL